MIKEKLSDLAIFGGRPLFEEQLHVGAPNIGDRRRLLDRIESILDSRRLTNRGPVVRELEREIAGLVGVKHCIAMCNGTVALEIATRALGLKGEVIVPSMTFVATPHALQWQEITPVFCDVDPETVNIDPRRIEQLITPRTSGILGVHLWGRPCDIDALASIARQNRLALLFDAAHAFGCSHGGRMIGSFGEAEIFSFHATKFVNAFEGGAVVTDNDDLAAKIRLMQNFGFEGKDNVIHLGTNGKMSEISAAMGLTSLECMEDFIRVNRRHYEHYLSEFDGLPGISMLRYDGRERSNYQFILLDIDPQAAGLSRDRLMNLLHAEGVIARRYFFPGCHRMEPYRSYQPHTGLWLPQTERIVERMLSLPTGTAVSEEQIHATCALIRFALRNGAALRERLGSVSEPVPA
jgi:dTDP-4-amino-4,6-dideoxygalactose transaminase